MFNYGMLIIFAANLPPDDHTLCNDQLCHNVHPVKSTLYGLAKQEDGSEQSEHTDIKLLMSRTLL